MKCPSCKGELKFSGSGTETHLKCTECGEGFTIDTGQSEALLGDIAKIRASAMDEVEKHLASKCDCGHHGRCWDAIGAIFKSTEEELRVIIAAAGEDRATGGAEQCTRCFEEPHVKIRYKGNACWEVDGAVYVEPFIVKAVNSYAQLVESLKYMVANIGQPACLETRDGFAKACGTLKAAGEEV